MFSSSTCLVLLPRESLFHLDFILLCDVKNESDFVFFFQMSILFSHFYILWSSSFSPGFETPPFFCIKFPAGSDLSRWCFDILERLRAWPVGTEEDTAHRINHMGYLAARLPPPLCCFQGSPGASDDCLVLACQVPGEWSAETLLLPQLPRRGLHCPQHQGPFLPSDPGVTSRSWSCSLSHTVLQSVPGVCGLLMEITSGCGARRIPSSSAVPGGGRGLWWASAVRGI